MSKFENITTELSHKRKTVDDLIRFISNRNENEPNYSLLLGAGCSITSGIRPAKELISEWKKEILLSDPNSKNFSEEDYLKSCSWYDPRNEYSCLFEKRYDLPQHRRMFIEKEVDGKKPSIGYEYLSKLIGNSYFRTIFTTNFDDLLNQSFYSYLKARPIVCAHDSSINSVTITSKRPKIIKLHGDYLFDGIKSSMREVETLEDNMRNKFTEFAKNYGLIVIGYAGNDRSIMDILSYLLKRDSYFSHGIYWCIRKDSEISNELKNLLWQERVFFVEIEGFDEFFAEVNAKTIKATPYEQMFSGYVSGLLKEINKSKDKFNKCEFILNDLKVSEKSLKETTYNDANMMSITDRENSSSDDSSIEDRTIISSINELISKDRFEEALKIIGNSIVKTPISKKLFSTISYAKAFCYFKQDRIDDAIKTYEDLIHYKEENELGETTQLYFRIIQITKSRAGKIETINRLLDKNPYIYEAYNEKAQILSESFENDIDPETTYEADLIESYSKSIGLHPSIDNEAYYDLMSFIIENDLHDKYKEKYDVCVAAYQKQNPFDINYIKCRASLTRTSKDYSEDAIFELINSAKKENKFTEKNYSYELELLNSLSKNNSLSKLSDQIKLMDKKYPKKKRFLIKKSEVLSSKFRDLESAIKVLEQALVIYPKDNLLQKRLFNFYIHNEDYENAEGILKNVKNITSLNDLKIDLFISRRDLLENQALLEDLKNNEKDLRYYVKYSYALLHLKKYDDLIEFLKSFSDKNDDKFDVLVINYNLAKVLKGESINLPRIQKIADRSKDDITKAAVKAVINLQKNDSTSKEECISFLTKGIEKNYDQWFECKIFPVFQKIDFNSLKKEKLEFSFSV